MSAVARIRINFVGGYELVSDRWECKVAWFLFLRDALNYAQIYTESDDSNWRDYVILDKKTEEHVSILLASPELMEV